jgi:hypothetical protein
MADENYSDIPMCLTYVFANPNPFSTPPYREAEPRQYDRGEKDVTREPEKGDLACKCSDNGLKDSPSELLLATCKAASVGETIPNWRCWPRNQFEQQICYAGSLSLLL